MRKRSAILLLTCLAVMLMSAVIPAAAQDDEIVWAFVPSADSETVLAGATELTDLIAEKTGIQITPVVATDFSGVIEAMCNGEAQMGALNTFSYILASGRGCADVGLISTRFGSAYYSGQFITLADSGIDSIDDLEGKTFCRPDPLSTSGWIVPSISMGANGVDIASLEIIDAGGHDSVVTGVLNGDCDAGATFVDARPQDVRDQVVVFAQTGQIPNDTISFSTDLDAETRQQITDALLEIGSDEQYVDLLTSTYNWGGLVAGEDAFFDDFRQELDAAGIEISELVPTPAPSTVGTQDDPIVWAFVPSADSEVVMTGATALTDLIQEQTGIYITPVVATDFSGVIEAMCNGEAGMGALNTFSYILAHSRGCADVGLVSTRFGSAYYSGQFITLADSGINSLDDLEGTTFCRPDALSTSGWIVPSISMAAAGVDLDSLEIVDAGGHDSVVTGVLNGDCDAGATFSDARPQDVRDQVIVFAQTGQIPNDTISFSSDVPADVQQQIKDALLAIAADTDNADLLSETYNWGGLIAGEDAFFDDFRQELDAAGIHIEDLAG
ncbi:MAG: phosphate/phosphite/phosphonate ABC transporter substrate-binding protein [Chloroflexota bacterium]